MFCHLQQPLNFLCAVADIHYIKLSRMACLRLVLFAQLFDEMVYRIILHNAHSTAAETAACDTGTDNALCLPCKIYQHIDLLAGNLIIIAQRYVRSIHQLAEFLHIACIESCNRLNRTLILIYCMVCSLTANRILDGVFVFFKFLFAKVTKPLDIYDCLQFL